MLPDKQVVSVYFSVILQQRCSCHTRPLSAFIKQQQNYKSDLLNSQIMIATSREQTKKKLQVLLLFPLLMIFPG